MFTFGYKIQGIPCAIKVTCFERDPGAERVDFDYEVLDRRGYRAEWLARKVSDEEDCEIFRIAKDEKDFC